MKLPQYSNDRRDARSLVNNGDSGFVHRISASLVETFNFSSVIRLSLLFLTRPKTTTRQSTRGQPCAGQRPCSLTKESECLNPSLSSRAEFLIRSRTIVGPRNYRYSFDLVRDFGSVAPAKIIGRPRCAVARIKGKFLSRNIAYSRKLS